MKSSAVSLATLLLALGTIGGDARAESFPDRSCHEVVWREMPSFATRFDGVPSLPKLPLPAYWSADPGWPTDPPDPGKSPLVNVTVRDPNNDIVEGELGVGFAIPGGDTYQGYTGTVLGRQLWWRPLEPLAAGEHRVSLLIVLPPGGGGPYCSFESFTASIPFTVVAEPPPPPQLELSASFIDVEVGGLDYGIDAACDARADTTPCPHEPGACCWLVSQRRIQFRAGFTISGTGTPFGYGHFTWLEAAHPDDASAVWRHAFYPVPTGESLDLYVTELSPQEFAALAPQPYCVTARVYSVMSGELVTEAEACVSPAEVVVEPPPPPICEFSLCQRRNFEPELPPEPAPDASADAAAEPLADAGGGDPDAGDPDAVNADLTPIDADPGRGQQPSGCGAAEPTGSDLLALLALLALIGASALAAGRRERALDGRSSPGIHEAKM